MRIDDANLGWVLCECGVKPRCKRTRTIARLAWVEGYEPEAIAAELSLSLHAVRCSLAALERRIRAQQALLDEGEPVKQVMRDLWEPEADPPPFSRQARHLRECVANRRVSSDHSPPVSHNTYTGVPEVLPQHPPAVSQREAETIVKDLAWFREKVREGVL